MFLKQLTRCCLIADWSKLDTLRIPWARAVAVAMAKTPQWVPPFCFSDLMILTVDDWNSWVMTAIVSLSTELHTESHTFTSPFAQPKFDARIQWSPRECITWSRLGKGFRSQKVFFACRTFGWRPLRCGNCRLSSCWAKPTWQSVSFFPLRMASVSTSWSIHVCVF